jgi:hypothetical protein
MNKKIMFSIGLLSGIAICGLLNWGINTSFMTVSIQGYNSLNDRVKDLESRQAYIGYELQSEKGNREYGLNNVYSTVRSLEDKLSDIDVRAMRTRVMSHQDELVSLKEALRSLQLRMNELEDALW